jgi:hypothetical protein
MIRIERMTAGALRRGGLSGGRLSLVVMDTLYRRGASRRALERAARSRLGVKHPAYSDASPVEYPPPGIRRDLRGVLVGEVRLTRDARWEDGTLYAHMPEVVSGALVGRRLGDVLDHPDADPETLIREPVRGDALLSVMREEVPLQRPTLLERLTHPRYRMRLWIEEHMDDAEVPAWHRRNTLLLVLGSLLVSAMVTGLHAKGEVGATAMAAMWLSTLYLASNAVGAHRPRRFSLLHGTQAAVHERHERTMTELEKETNG